MDIIAAGCTFPSGPTIALADVALRTQLALTCNHPFCVDRCGVPVKTSHFPSKELDFTSERWSILADNALRDALLWAPYVTKMPSRIWLVLPLAERTGVPPQLAETLTAQLLAAFPASLSITVCRGGHAEGGVAIMQTLQQPTQAEQHIDIVLAVDSWHHPDALMWLEQEHLLHGSYQTSGNTARPNPGGRVPGEGAAVIILAKDAGKQCWCTVRGIATAQEHILRNDDRPCIGLGLTQAAHQAIEQASVAHLTHLVTDMNGEPYRSDEYGFTVSRLNQVLDEDWVRIAPVLSTGDLGCASVITHIALTAWRLKHAAITVDEQHLILSSSDDERRCAIVLGDTAWRKTL